MYISNQPTNNCQVMFGAKSKIVGKCSDAFKTELEKKIVNIGKDSDHILVDMGKIEGYYVVPSFDEHYMMRSRISSTLNGNKQNWEVKTTTPDVIALKEKTNKFISLSQLHEMQIMSYLSKLGA